MENIDYINDFEAFQSNFKRTEVSGEEIGEIIMKMAGYFARYNMKMGQALRVFSGVKAKFQNSIDEVTGKSMTSSKAEVLADATEEANTYEMSRIHVNNIQEYINSLKSLQRGIINEYANTN